MTYTLTYFNGRGRAELARLLFAEAGVAYEDKRLTGEQWGSLKASGQPPFGQLPVLQVDGETMYGQSSAISRFLARRFELFGANDLEGLQIDMIMEHVAEMTSKMVHAVFHAPEDKKAVAKEELLHTFLPRHLGMLSHLLKGDYFVGQNVTVADFSVFALLEWVVAFLPELQLPENVKAHFDRVKARPKIAEWISKRPESAF